VQWPAGLNPLHNPAAERSPPPTPVGRAAAIDRPTVAKNDTQQRGTLHHHAPEPRAGGSIKRDDPGAGADVVVRGLFRRQLRSEPPVHFQRQLKPRIRRPQQPRSGGVIVRAVPHIDVEICTIVAVLHVWQRRPAAAQAIRPITGAGLVTHFEAFWVRDENQNRESARRTQLRFVPRARKTGRGVHEHGRQGVARPASRTKGLSSTGLARQAVSIVARLAPRANDRFPLVSGRDAGRVLQQCR